MRRRKLWFLLIAPFAIAAFIFIGGEIVMHLWNWLTPLLFGFRMITFWQALGLLILCRILFGGLGSHGGRSYRMRDRFGRQWERRFARDWHDMTPEERERFKQRFRERFERFPEHFREHFGGPFDPPKPESPK